MGLRHIFGNKPIPSLIDFLLVHKHWDYSLAEISEATGVSYRTLQTVIPMLLKQGIVIKTREVGKAKMYRLNFDSPSIKKLNEFALASDLEFAEKQGKISIAQIVRTRKH